MSEFDEESVLAMKIDPKDRYLLAGDTAGFIAIFDIKNYCTSPQSTVSLDLIIQDHSTVLTLCIIYIYTTQCDFHSE